MIVNSKLEATVKRSKRAFAISLILVLAALSKPALADLNTGDGGWLAGMVRSGSEPFDQLDPSAGNDLVRTHDLLSYRVGFTTINGSDTNARIIVRAGAFTLPSNYTGEALTTIGYFDPIDMPTSCINVSSMAVNDPPATGISGISADGQTLFCAQPSPTNGNNLDFSFRISGLAPNGASLAPINVAYESDQTSINSTPQSLLGTVGVEEFFGLNNVTIRSEPRWNLRVEQLRGGTYVPASGPNGEDGFVFSWSLGVMGLGSRKGQEMLQPPFDFNVNFADSDFPNAQIIDWDMQTPGYISVNFSAAGSSPHHGCGNLYNQLRVIGNYFDNRHHRPNDSGTVGLGAVADVANGGDCRLSNVPPNTRTATLSTDHTDFSLRHWPSKHGRNPTAVDLVNANNVDDASNEWWVANKSVLVWAPDTDIVVNSTEFLTLQGQLNGTSATGQNNSEPDANDNSSTSGASRTISGSMSEIHTPPVWSNPYGLDYTVRDPNITEAPTSIRLHPIKY